MSRRPQGRGVGVDGGALRWPWGGGSGEAQLGLGSGGRQGWGLGAETQVLEDPARDERVGEGGDAVAAAAARGAAQHVDREGPLEEPTGAPGEQGASTVVRPRAERERETGGRRAEERLRLAEAEWKRSQASCEARARTTSLRFSATPRSALLGTGMGGDTIIGAGPAAGPAPPRRPGRRR